MDDPPRTSLADIPTDALYRLLEPVTKRAGTSFANWGRTFACTPLAIFEPVSEHQCTLVLELARRERKTVRIAGVGHSPSDLALTNEFMLSTLKLNQVLEVRLPPLIQSPSCLTADR